jgi:hypothetical protein
MVQPFMLLTGMNIYIYIGFWMKTIYDGPTVSIHMVTTQNLNMFVYKGLLPSQRKSIFLLKS